MALQKDQAVPKSGLFTITNLVWRTIVLGLLAGVVAALYTLTLDNEYAAESGLLLAPLPFGQAVWSGDKQAENNPAAQIGYLMGRPLNVRGYELLLRNDEMVKQLRDTLTTLYAERGEDEELPLEDVRKAMTLRTQIFKQTAYDVEYVPLIVLAYRATDPEIAAAMANEWSELAIALSKELSAKGTTGSLEFLQGRFEGVNQQLEEIEQAIQEHETLWDLDSLTLRLQDTQKLITEYELDQIRLSTDIESYQAELAEIEKDLQTTGEKTTLRKAPSDEAYWLMEATGQGNPDSSDVLESEVVNEVFVIMREKGSDLQSKVAGLIKKRDAGAAALENLRTEVTALQQNLAEQKRVRTELERRAEVSKLQYQRIAENLEAARVAEAETEPDLKIAYDAVPPETKIGPHRSVMVLTAAFLGALVVPIHFFVLLSIRRFAVFLDATAAGTSGKPA
jgi:uncharacterized protein involved in exopolysaccharide biosynthesis